VKGDGWLEENWLKQDINGLNGDMRLKGDGWLDGKVWLKEDRAAFDISMA